MGYCSRFNPLASLMDISWTPVGGNGANPLPGSPSLGELASAASLTDVLFLYGRLPTRIAGARALVARWGPARRAPAHGGDDDRERTMTHPGRAAHARGALHRR